jgi:hypothetical protein
MINQVGHSDPVSQQAVKWLKLAPRLKVMRSVYRWPL